MNNQLENQQPEHVKVFHVTVASSIIHPDLQIAHVFPQPWFQENSFN